MRSCTGFVLCSEIHQSLRTNVPDDGSTMRSCCTHCSPPFWQLFQQHKKRALNKFHQDQPASSPWKGIATWTQSVKTLKPPNHSTRWPRVGSQTRFAKRKSTANLSARHSRSAVIHYSVSMSHIYMRTLVGKLLTRQHLIPNVCPAILPYCVGEIMRHAAQLPV